MKLDDGSSINLKGFDTDHIESCPAGPRFNIKPGDGAALLGIFDQAGVTAYEDTPPLAHCLVDMIDLEGDDTGDLGGHRVRGPQNDGSSGEDEVHRDSDRA